MKEEYLSECRYGVYAVLIVDKEWCFLKGCWAVVSPSWFGSLARKTGILDELSRRGYVYKFKSLGGIFFEKSLTP